MKLIQFFLILILSIHSAGATNSWADESYNYSVNNQVPDGERPYQLLFNISNNTGTNNETTIFCNGHCNVNFTDVRFYLNNETILSYWIENNETGRIWVNITDNGTVNMYYGNETSISLSNGTDTFPFFDDFEDGTLNKWQVIGAPTVSVSWGYNGYGVKSSGDVANYIYHEGYNNSKLILEFRYKRIAGDSYGGLTNTSFFTPPYRLLGTNSATYGSFVKNSDASGYENFFAIDGNWHKAILKVRTNNTKYILDSIDINTTDSFGTYKNLIFTTASPGTPIAYFDEIFVHSYSDSEPIIPTWEIQREKLEVTNINSATTKKTITWTWVNPTLPIYQCTEYYLDNVYQACSSATSAYLTELTPTTSHTLSTRVKDTDNIFYPFVNDTRITLTTTDSPIITSYTSDWFSPILNDNFPINVNYNSFEVPIKNISIEIKTKDENTHVRYIDISYDFDYTVINTTKILNWDGKADNYEIVPDAYYIWEATVTDFDNNVGVFINTTGMGVDNTYPSSIMDLSKSRLFKSLYYKSNYSSEDPLRVNLGYYYGDYTTNNVLTINPTNNDTSLSYLVIKKLGYINITEGISTFSVSKDADGSAWMWIDEILVYNSNAGITSTQLTLTEGMHEVSIEYSKGATNSSITLIPEINATEMTFVTPISNDNLTLFANDFNGSGISTITYSIDYGQTYNTYSTPVNLSGIPLIFVCTIDLVGNGEICKSYTSTFVDPPYPPLPPPPPPPPTTTPPPANTPLPTPPQPTPTATPPPLPTPTPPNNGTLNNSFNRSFPPPDNDNSSTPPSDPWNCCGFGSYLYNYFDKSIYPTSNGTVDYKLMVVQFNNSFSGIVLTRDSLESVFDLFLVGAFPYPYEVFTERENTLKTREFGIIRADIITVNLSYPFFDWLTSAQAIYAPITQITPTQSYNIGDTIEFSVNITPWDDNHSSTIEIPDVKALLYSPPNPYTGEDATLLEVFDMQTVTRAGGNWTFNRTTNLYTDLVGNYNVILWMPSIGGNINQNSITVGYGSISPSIYNQIKLYQFNNIISVNCPVGWCYVAQNFTNSTLISLNNNYSTSTSQGHYLSSGQKIESHIRGLTFNENKTVLRREGIIYYFNTYTTVTFIPPGASTVSLNTGWNLLGNFNGGINGSTIGELKTNITNVTTAKYYNKTSKSWEFSDSTIVPLGEAFYAQVTSSSTWNG